MAACALSRVPRVVSGAALCWAFTKQVPNEFKYIADVFVGQPDRCERRHFWLW